VAEPSADLPRESPRTILFQFVFFPLGIVCVAVAVFLLFGKLASDEQSIPDYLNQIRSGSQHERWQAAYQLSKSLKRGEAKRYSNLEQQVASIYTGSKNDDPRIRRYLSMVLGTLGDRRATPVLIDGSRDADPENRIYAALALGELRDPAAIPRLAEMAKEEDDDVRKTAVFALGETGDVRAVPPLGEAVADPRPDVRWNAAVALSRFDDPRSVGPLREMLTRERLAQLPTMREDQKEDAMIVAMQPYKRLGGAEAAQLLAQIANGDPSLRVRAAAKQALGGG
jgi:HEAT repeat protein